MLEILIIVCALAALVWTPIEAKKVHDGWVRAKFKGTPEEFRAKYVKQMKMLTVVGFVLGGLYVVLAFVIAEDEANLAVKLFIGALWIGVATMNLVLRRKYFPDVVSA